MSYKKKILTIMTLLVLLLLTMSTTIQAASVGKVYNLKATMNGSLIKLTWSSVSDATGYNVYVNDTKIGSVSTNQASLIGFSNNTTYRFKIAAYDSKNREGTLSTEVKFTTTGKETLAQVKNLTVTQVNGYVNLNWSSVNKADKYQIFVDVPNFGEVNIGEVTSTNAMVYGFKEGKKYGFSVRACQTLSSGELNYGEKSSIKYCTINYNKDDSNNNTEISNIGTVKDVKVSSITDTEVTVSWSKNSDADGYEVLLSKNNGTYKTVADKSGTKAYLYDLTPDTSYRVKVIPYEKVNGTKKYGEESSYVKFVTEEEEDYTPDKVKNVSVTKVTESSAYVSWSSVSNATGYNIYVSKNNGEFKYWGNTTSNNYTLKDLDDDTNYKVKVEAYRKVNGKEYKGSYSTAKSFKTEEKKKTTTLDTVTHLEVEIKNRNEAYLTWWPVEDATGYEVYISKEGSGYKRITWTTDNIAILTSEMLDYSTNYKVKVRAYKNEYYNKSEYKTIRGDFSSVKSFKTEKYDKTQNNPNVAKVTGVKTVVKGTSAYLTWNKVSEADGYEIYFTIPGMGYTILYTNTNSREILGVTGKDYDYTARVRAYKYVNGVKTYGQYSDIVKFREN